MKSTSCNQGPGMVLCLLLIATPLFAVRSQETAEPTAPRQYLAEFHVYRVSDTPISILTADDVRAVDRLRGRISEAGPVSCDFEDMNIRDVLDFLVEGYNVNILVDNRVVPPPDYDGSDEDAVDYPTDGFVPYIHLKNVSFESALGAILRPLGLTYTVQPGFLWVTAPEHAERESFYDRYIPDDSIQHVPRGALRIGDTTIPLVPHEDRTQTLDLEGHTGIELISRPNMLTLEGQPGTFKIQSDQAVAYLEPLIGVSEETLYALRRRKYSTVALETELSQKGTRIVTARVGIEATYVADRETLPGTTLRVGRPILETASREITFDAALKRRQALLTQIGDDVLLVVFRFAKFNPVEYEATREGSQQFTLETKFLRVMGTPDWSTWRIERNEPEGQRSWGGPVDLDEWERYSEDPEQLGFVEVDKAVLESAPRVTHFVDSVERLRDQRSPMVKMVVSYRAAGDAARSADTSTFSNVSEIDWFNVFSPDGSGSERKRDDYAGKAIVADVGRTVVEYTDPDGGLFSKKRELALNTGVVMSLDAESTPSEGVYRINQRVRLHWPRSNQPRRIVGEQAARVTHFYAAGEWSYETRDGDTVAYLLPADIDEYFLVVSTFTLLEPASHPSSRN